jgi:predicted deacylase
MASFAESWGVAPGEKLKTWLKIGSDPLTEISLPLWLAEGKEEGPLVAITAGVHGCEYDSILAAVSFFTQLDVSKLRGTVAVIPVANPVGFSHVSRYVCPIDNLNLNRVFPGDKDGSITQRIASTIFEELVLHSKYLMDLHGGDLFEALLPHTKYFVTGNTEIDRAAKTVAITFTDRLYQPVHPTRRPSGGNLYSEAAKRGVISIIAEAGGEGRIDKRNIEFHKSGVLNVLQWIDMLPGKSIPSGDCEEVLNAVKVQSNHGGFFIPEVSLGDKVGKGNIIGRIKDINGSVIERLVSPTKGIVMMLFTIGVVNTGDPLAILWETKVIQQAVK